MKERPLFNDGVERLALFPSKEVEIVPDGSDLLRRLGFSPVGSRMTEVGEGRFPHAILMNDGRKVRVIQGKLSQAVERRGFVHEGDLPREIQRPWFVMPDRDRRYLEGLGPDVLRRGEEAFRRLAAEIAGGFVEENIGWMVGMEKIRDEVLREKLRRRLERLWRERKLSLFKRWQEWMEEGVRLEDKAVVGEGVKKGGAVVIAAGGLAMLTPSAIPVVEQVAQAPQEIIDWFRDFHQSNQEEGKIGLTGLKRVDAGPFLDMDIRIGDVGGGMLRSAKEMGLTREEIIKLAEAAALGLGLVGVVELIKKGKLKVALGLLVTAGLLTACGGSPTVVSPTEAGPRVTEGMSTSTSSPEPTLEPPLEPTSTPEPTPMPRLGGQIEGVVEPRALVERVREDYPLEEIGERIEMNVEEAQKVAQLVGQYGLQLVEGEDGGGYVLGWKDATNGVVYPYVPTVIENFELQGLKGKFIHYDGKNGYDLMGVVGLKEDQLVVAVIVRNPDSPEDQRGALRYVVLNKDKQGGFELAGVLDPFVRGDEDREAGFIYLSTGAKLIDLDKFPSQEKVFEATEGRELLRWLAGEYPDLRIGIVNESEGIVRIGIGGEGLVTRVKRSGDLVWFEKVGNSEPVGILINGEVVGVERKEVSGGIVYQVGDREMVVVGGILREYDPDRYEYDSGSGEWVEAVPEAVVGIVKQIKESWATNATYTPATVEQVTYLAEVLGVEPAKLGQVYRVEAENGAVFWASAETGQTYAIRQVPDYWKYENGEKIDVPAHEEVVMVEEVINDPVEFSHWGDGRVVKVKYEDGNEGWLYLNEQGEWAKIYESGFDYEFLSQVEEHFEEVTGKSPEEWMEKAAGSNLGHLTWGAKTDLGRIADHPEVSWWEGAFHGFFAGTGWVKLADGGSGFIVVEAFPKYDRTTRKSEVILIPIWVGMEKGGRWQGLIGGTADGRIWFVGDDGRMDSGNEKLVEGVFGEANLGKYMLTSLEIYGEPEKIIDEFQENRGAKSENPHAYFVLNSTVIKMIQEGKLNDWGIWFASLPKEEQKALLASSEKGEGILPWIVVEDTEKLEELLEKYPLPEKPVGFWADTVKVKSRYNLGDWIYP